MATRWELDHLEWSLAVAHRWLHCALMAAEQAGEEGLADDLHLMLAGLTLAGGAQLERGQRAETNRQRRQTALWETRPGRP